MGIDLKSRSRARHNFRTAPKSHNVYLRLLLKLYKFMARRTDSKFNRIILKRLCHSRVNRAPMSISRISKYMKGKDGKIAVIVGPVLNDERLFKVPKLRVCALHFAEPARQRITKAGGECLTFDQLALIAPKGQNTVLLRGKRTVREAYRHFGSPGTPGSHAAPHVPTRGSVTKRYDRARGRRPSKGYKVRA